MTGMKPRSEMRPRDDDWAVHGFVVPDAAGFLGEIDRNNGDERADLRAGNGFPGGGVVVSDLRPRRWHEECNRIFFCVCNLFI